jgi:hypothetical protein
VKVATYGALMGALLAISAVETAEAADCTYVCKAPPHVKAVHHAPARMIRRSAEASYAQSFYDYRSSSHVGEVFVRTLPAPIAMIPNDGFQVAPNDAHIRFVREEKVVYVPVAAYPQPYPPAYYPQPLPGVSLDERQFNIGGGGGVGYAAEGGGGGGGGGGFIYSGQTEQDVPPNGGGVNLPAGYGPSYLNAWQSGNAPARGGLVLPSTTK